MTGSSVNTTSLNVSANPTNSPPDTPGSSSDPASETSPLKNILENAGNTLTKYNIHRKALGENFSAKNILVGGRLENSQVFHITHPTDAVSLCYIKEENANDFEPRLGKVTIDNGEDGEEIDFSEYKELTIDKIANALAKEGGLALFINSFENSNKKLYDELILAQDKLNGLTIQKLDSKSHEVNKFRSAVKLVQALENANAKKTPEFKFVNSDKYHFGQDRASEYVIHDVLKELKESKGIHALISTLNGLNGVKNYQAVLYDHEETEITKFEIKNTNFLNNILRDGFDNASEEDKQGLIGDLLKSNISTNTEANTTVTAKEKILEHNLNAALREFISFFDSETKNPVVDL